MAWNLSGDLARSGRGRGLAGLLALMSVAATPAAAQNYGFVGSEWLNTSRTVRLDYLWNAEFAVPNNFGNFFYPGCSAQQIVMERDNWWEEPRWVAGDFPSSASNAQCNRTEDGEYQRGLATWDSNGNTSLHIDHGLDRNPPPTVNGVVRPFQQPLNGDVADLKTRAPGEDFVVASGHLVEEGDELYRTITILEDARYEVGDFAWVEAEDLILVDGGELYVDGILLGHELWIEDGRVVIGEEGIYFDYSPDYSGETTLNGGELIILGGFLTDNFVQRSGYTYIGPEALYFDWLGSRIDDGELVIAGLYDTESFAQLGGATWVQAGGELYDAYGISVVINSDLRIDGVLDTVRLQLHETELSGSGDIYAPAGITQFGGSIRPGRVEGVGGEALYLGGDLYLRDAEIGVDLSAAGIDTLLIDGVADLEAGITLNLDPNFQPLRGSRFAAVQTSGGISAADLTLTAPIQSPVLSYGLDVSANSVFVELQAGLYAPLAASEQQRALATALDAALVGGASTDGLMDISRALDYRPDVASLQAGLQSASPSDTFSMDPMGFGIARMMGELVSERGRALRGTLVGNDGIAMDDRTTAYMSVRKHWGDTGLPNGAFDLDQSHGAIGIEVGLSEKWTVGGAFSFSDYGAGRAGAHAQGEAVSLLGYTGLNKGAWFAQAYLGVSWLDYDLSRQIIAGNMPDIAQGNVDADQTSAGFMAGAEFKLGAWHAGPILQLRHGEIRYDAYSETGAGAFNAQLVGRDADQTLLGFGAHAARAWETSLGAAQLSGQLTWEQDVSQGDYLTQAALQGAPGAAFVVTNLGHDDGFAALDIGLSVQTSHRTSLSAGVNVDLGRESDARQGGQVSIHWRF